jgi:hypothetical protein
MAMTPEQCKAARILAKIDGDALAAAAGVDLSAIRAFESGVTRSDAELGDRLALALENLGVIFLLEENGCGAGVRLKFDRAATRQLGRWESEGGKVADDDVP